MRNVELGLDTAQIYFRDCFQHLLNFVKDKFIQSANA
jgi:hypothetical protein